MSELLPINGVDQLGPIPAEAQTLVSFSAPIAVGAKEPVAGLALLKYLSPRRRRPLPYRLKPPCRLALLHGPLPTMPHSDQIEDKALLK